VIRANVTRQDGSTGNSLEEVFTSGGDLNYIEGALPLGLSRQVRRVNSKALEITTLRDGVKFQVDRVDSYRRGGSTQNDESGASPRYLRIETGLAQLSATLFACRIRARVRAANQGAGA
jgi:hypothetical protein